MWNNWEAFSIKVGFFWNKIGWKLWFAHYLFKVMLRIGKTPMNTNWRYSFTIEHFHTTKILFWIILIGFKFNLILRTRTFISYWLVKREFVTLWWSVSFSYCFDNLKRPMSKDLSNHYNRLWRIVDRNVFVTYRVARNDN